MSLLFRGLIRFASVIQRHPYLTFAAGLLPTPVLLLVVGIVNGWEELCALAACYVAILATILALPIALRRGGTQRQIRSTTLRLIIVIATLAPLYALPLHYWRESNRKPCRHMAGYYSGVSARMNMMAAMPGAWIDKYRDDLRALSAIASWKGQQYEGASDFEGVLERIARTGPDQTRLDQSWTRFKAEAAVEGFTIPTK